MTYKVTLNGRTYEVEVEAGKAILLDEYVAISPMSTPAPAPVAAPVEAAPAAPAPAAAPAAPVDGQAVEAPMPGNILKVNVSVGQSVGQGDVLVVLEAMKMENEIMAPRDGTVVSVSAIKGAAVESGALLCVLQ